MSDHEAIVSSLLETSWGQDLTPEHASALRSCGRGALDFGEFLEKLDESQVISPDVERVAHQILWGARNFARARSAAETYVDFGRYEEIDYANETTLNNAESHARLKELAKSVAETMRPISMRWPPYSSMLELREEYRAHIQVFSRVDALVSDRLSALMQMSRLQFIFLANTFC